MNKQSIDSKIQYRVTMIDNNLELLDKDNNLYNALKNIYKALAGFQVIDPKITNGALKLLQDYFRTLSKDIHRSRTNSHVNKLLTRTLKYANPNAKWNVLVSFSPKMVVDCTDSEAKVQSILDCLKEDDQISLFTY